MGKNNNIKGFTIIEVLIVICIIGLILIVIFLAVPALQRNNRNIKRKNDAIHINALVQEYQSLNNNIIPLVINSTCIDGVPHACINISNDNFAIKEDFISTHILPTWYWEDLDDVYTTQPQESTDEIIYIVNGTCDIDSNAVIYKKNRYAVLYFTEPDNRLNCLVGN